MELVLLLWIASGIISALVASKKGHSGCLWFFVGILLGPLGFLFSFATRNLKDPRFLERKAIRKGEMKICPFCAEAVRADAIKCRYCGEVLPRNE
jgi:hypothetical protein